MVEMAVGMPCGPESWVAGVVLVAGLAGSADCARRVRGGRSSGRCGRGVPTAFGIRRPTSARTAWWVGL